MAEPVLRIATPGVLARGQFGALAGAARGGGAISIRVGVLARHLS